MSEQNQPGPSNDKQAIADAALVDASLDDGGATPIVSLGPADEAIWIPRDGYDRIKAEFDYLSGEGRASIAKKVDAVREEQDKVEGRILQLQQLLDNVRVGEPQTGEAVEEAHPTSTPSAPATKAARQARVAAILLAEQVHSQEQLAALLNRYAGIHVTQATLSRDLGELGVVRLRAVDGSLVYVLPNELGGPEAPPGMGLNAPKHISPPDEPANSLTPAEPTQAPLDPVTGSVPSPARHSALTGSASQRLAKYLKELLTSAEASGNLVVLRTPAGAAQFLASAIDHATWPEIMGTVAGDDTVLIIARDPSYGGEIAAEFRHLAERHRLR